MGNGNSNDLHKFWGEYTDALIEYLTGEFMMHELNHKEHKLYILLS